MFVYIHADWRKSASSVDWVPQGNWRRDSNSRDIVASSPSISHPAAGTPRRACLQAIAACNKKLLVPRHLSQYFLRLLLNIFFRDLHRPWLLFPWLIFCRGGGQYSNTLYTPYIHLYTSYIQPYTPNIQGHIHLMCTHVHLYTPYIHLCTSSIQPYTPYIHPYTPYIHPYSRNRSSFFFFFKCCH